MKQYNGEKYIISITSFPKRFKFLSKTIFNLIKNQTYKNFHLAVTLYKDEYKNLTNELKLFIDRDLIEIIIAEENLCPHLKYFYVMQKYWDKPIITFDDDRIYSSNIIEVLVNKYESLNYKSIISNVAPKMTKNTFTLNDANVWCVGSQRLLPNEKSYIAMAEGFGGVLYPPYCFNELEKCVDEIKTCLYHDDMYLKVLAIRNKIPVTQSNAIWGSTITGQDIQGADETSMYKNYNHTIDYRVKVTKLFENDLLKGFEL